jgi:hypothetical protein
MRKWSLLNSLTMAGLLAGAWTRAAGQDVARPLPTEVRPTSPAPVGAPIPPPALAGVPTPPPPPPPAATPPSAVISQDASVPAAVNPVITSDPPPNDKLPFKWTWGGQYRIDPNSANFPFQPLVITNDQHTESFVQQRMRLWATVNPNEHVEGYIQVQLGGTLWGQNADFGKTFNAPFPVPPPNQDVVGVELRRGWVAYQDEECGKLRAGILDWHDSFGDTLASSDYDFNIGGVDWTKVFKECNNLKVVLAALFLSDLPLITTDDVPVGSHTSWLLAADVDQPLGEKSSVGGSVYYLTDRGDYSYPTYAPYRSSWDVWLGVRAKTVLMDTVPVNGFALLNSGEREDLEGVTVLRHTGFAGKFEIGPIEFGPGKFSAQALYASGSDTPGFGTTSEFRTVAQTYRDNFGAQGYWSYLYLTSPNGPADTKDLGVSLQNRGLGLFTVQAKYEYPLCGKLSGTSAVGWLRAANPNPTSGGTEIGTEVSQMVTYNFGGGLKLDVGTAYLFTGDFYQDGPLAPSPHGLWELFSRLQLEF